MNITPAMQQYYDMKDQYQDCVLFFRMWDFYEMFEQDAKIAHKILWIALTTRNKNAENPILLAGIPFHAKEKYLPLFIEAGYKVAIAEQVSDPKAKGIVQREVVRVVTPATLELEWENYESASSNTMLSLVSDGNKYALSSIDILEHTWICSEFQTLEECLWQIYKLSPSEVILEKELFSEGAIREALSKKYNLNIYYHSFNKKSYQYLCQYFWSKNLEGFGIENKFLAQEAAAMLHDYISENQKVKIDFLKNISYDSFSWYMDLDESTIKSLDLIYNISTGSKTTGTLFWALDHTNTPMGKRFLREQLLRPLQDSTEIIKRQKFIDGFKSDAILLDKVRSELKYVADIDAILTRLSLERVWPRDLLALKRSLVAVREVITLIEASWNSNLKKLIK